MGDRKIYARLRGYEKTLQRTADYGRRTHGRGGKRRGAARMRRGTDHGFAEKGAGTGTTENDAVRHHADGNGDCSAGSCAYNRWIRYDGFPFGSFARSIGS